MYARLCAEAKDSEMSAHAFTERKTLYDEGAKNYHYKWVCMCAREISSRALKSFKGVCVYVCVCACKRGTNI